MEIKKSHIRTTIFHISSGKCLHIKVTPEKTVIKDHFILGEKWYFVNVNLWGSIEKKAVNLFLATTMFHKNQNQTTEDAPFVSYTACIKHRLSIYFFQEIIPFYKEFHIFWNLKTPISVECHLKEHPFITESILTCGLNS